MNKSAYVRKHYAQKKEYCAQIKAERGCKDCGNTNPIVLQFHHRDKATNITSWWSAAVVSSVISVGRIFSPR
jgi:hypothetical protein